LTHPPRHSRSTKSFPFHQVIPAKAGIFFYNPSLRCVAVALCDDDSVTARTAFNLIPWALVMLRLALGPLLLRGAVTAWPGKLLVAMLAAGLLSDIFDGVIARRLHVATPALRQADTIVDLVFWIFVACAAEIHSGGFIKDHAWLLGALLAAELANQLLSLLRFRRTSATHAYAAKLWGLTLFFGFACLLTRTPAAVFINFVLVFGIAVNLEGLAIIALAKERPVDVKSILSLLAARRRVITAPPTSSRTQ
jgi:CDP-diacylglycerol--glycerol-3-phosphate 3-phosphatidyltransferase